MISVITGGVHHQYRVQVEVDRLQDKGFNVTKIERVSREYLLFFGEDVTHIHYERKKD
jgi:hypothetical protein